MTRLGHQIGRVLVVLGARICHLLTGRRTEVVLYNDYELVTRQNLGPAPRRVKSGAQ